MTTYRHENAIIAQQDDTTVFWRVAPSRIKWVMDGYEAEIAVIDNLGESYSGDDFWALAGELAWDTSAVPS